MRKVKGGLRTSNLKFFSAGKEGMDKLEELVHDRYYSLPVAEALSDLLLIVLLENRVAGYALLSHKEHIFSQGSVTMLDDTARSGVISGLVYARVGSNEGDELLVCREPADVIAGEGCEYLHLLLVHLLLIGKESLGELAALLHNVAELPHGILDKGLHKWHSDGVPGKFLEKAAGDVRLASWPSRDEGVQLAFGGCGDGGGAAVFVEDVEHCVGKYVQLKDFRPSLGQVALELGLGPGHVLRHLLASSCYCLVDLVYRIVLPTESIVIEEAVSCNAQRVGAVRLCAAQRQGGDEPFDCQRVLDAHACALASEEVLGGYMVAPCGLHDEGRPGWDAGEELVEGSPVHPGGPFAEIVASLRDDSVVELAVCDVYSTDRGHNSTSMVSNGSPYPISRLNEALWLNQPIGIKRDPWTNSLRSSKLRKYVVLRPINYISNLCLFYRLYY